MKLTAKERRMKKRLKQVQRHHITYEPEWIVPIFKGEHWILSQIQRRKYHSEGFVLSLEYMLSEIKKGKIYKLKLERGKKWKKGRRR